MIDMFFDPMRRSRILVIGDVMLDVHSTYAVSGISPEDDVAPKLQKIESTYSAGGAANVALNLASLGSDVSLLGLVNPGDTAGIRLSDLLAQTIPESRLHLLFTDAPTIVKERILTKNGRYICRLDTERTYTPLCDFLPELEERIVRTRSYDLVVISDYAKGTISDAVLQLLKNCKMPYIVDPKTRPLSHYPRARLFTPNEKEFNALVGGRDKVYTTLQPEQDLILKQSERGATLFRHVLFGITEELFPAAAREVGDPTGCGDSFLAALARALSVGTSLQDACRVAVAAGSCAYDHRGVYLATCEDVRKELERQNADRH